VIEDFYGLNGIEIDDEKNNEKEILEEIEGSNLILTKLIS
jgi:hypothetical protein